MAFATADNMISFFDSRTLGDLVSDDGDRVAAGSLANDSNMTAALQAASGRIISAIGVGGRYTRSDLEGLTGEQASYLAYLTCCCAYWILWQRRTWTDAYRDQMESAKQRNDEALKMLKAGSEIFEIQSNVDASQPYVSASSVPDVTLNYNLVADRCRGQLFPPRRRPRGMS